MQAPLFGAFHALAVDDAGCGTGFAPPFFTTLDVQLMIDAVQRAVPVPEAEVIMHGASGRQVFRQRTPLAAGAQYVHHGVEHLAHVDAPLAAAPLGGRNKRLDMRPFLVGQVAGIAHLIAVVAGTVFGGPHGAPHETNRCHPGNHIWFSQFKRLPRLTDSSDSQCLRTDTKVAVQYGKLELISIASLFFYSIAREHKAILA